ncbi:hypothetical protein [Azospirillum canadense]|uniref:hypothetical protein n=1 Tax=Azospirillum canadense TaxID=403962 RepID=UPI002226089E|nr:hypothetical protein [Azospirillum canadense]MCW2236935.1 hypothetical protein [Azospirillum canadense]
MGLFLALALYGLFSAPAPSDIRMAEAGIGLLLLLAIGLRRPLYVATAHALRDPRLDGWETPAVLALAWLLWVPVLRGVWVGWAPGDMLRDVVPLLYLFLPVLLVPLLDDDAELAVRRLRWGLMLAGAAFALRWWKQASWGFGAVGSRAMADGGVYLLNAPSVLFAAIALPLTGIQMATRGGVAQRTAGAVCLALGFLCLGALAGAVHRMALGLAAAAFLVVGVWRVRRAPLAVGLALLAVAGVVLAFPDMVVGALTQVAEKNRLAGANTRWEEAAAVVALTIADPGSFLFGQGWGALIANPAVGGWRVSYTHTLPTYALAKTGLLGALALSAYILALAPRALSALRCDPPLAWAVLPPLVMAFCVHTSFKYLDTGLLLTLLLLTAERRNALSSS